MDREMTYGQLDVLWYGFIWPIICPVLSWMNAVYLNVVRYYGREVFFLNKSSFNLYIVAIHSELQDSFRYKLIGYLSHSKDNVCQSIEN